MKRIFSIMGLIVILAAALVAPVLAASAKTVIGINVVLTGDISDAILADLGAYGKVRDVFYEIDALTMQTSTGDLEAIRALPYGAAANPDAERQGAPVDSVFVEDFSDGLSTWDLDAVNVTDFGFDNRQVAYDENHRGCLVPMPGSPAFFFG